MKRRMLLAGFSFLLLLFISGCRRESPGNNYNGMNSGVQSVTEGALSSDIQFLGVVKDVDEENGTVKLYDVEGEQDMELSYSGGSDIQDQYGQIITMSQVPVGEVVDAYYNMGRGRLSKLQISGEAWSYEGIDRREINRSTRIMQIAQRQYRYGKDLVITDGRKLLDMIDINDKDELAARGIGGTIYSLTVTKGHGYIRFRNYDAFVGGYAEIGRDVFSTVTENMLLVVREGQYEVYLRKGELTGRKMVTVAANQEVVVDMGEYRPEPERVGQIAFLISPEGADLYINETLTDYEEPVELNYGRYDVRVSMTGYEDWTGVLTVGSAYTPIEINLAVAGTANSEEEEEGPNITIEGENGNVDETVPTKEPEATQAPSPSLSPGGGTTVTEAPETGTSGAASQKVTEDKDHTITVATPVLTQVYVNGAYKGTSPVSFPKLIGELTITLCRDGYVNRSYSITVEDDKKDITLNLVDLEKTSG